MEDLLENFAGQHLGSPIEESYKFHFLNDSPGSSAAVATCEEGYIHHFVNGSPAGSEGAGPTRPAPTTPPENTYNYPLSDGSPVRPVRPARTVPAGRSHDDIFLDNDIIKIPKATDFDVEDEANYNADVDDYDDDDEESGRVEAFHRSGDGANNKISLNAAMYKKMSLFEDDIPDSDRSFHKQDNDNFETQGDHSRAMYKNSASTLARNADGQSESDDFAQRLRQLHRQDVERDELLTQLHQENMELKRVLKESVPGGNPRAEAAERRLFEIRKALDKTPYVCVLIDGKGYKIQESLLQSGRKGGVEAADRIRTEVSNYLQQFGDAKDWGIMVHLYIDIEDLLARCVSADIPLSDKEVRNFMLGFTQAQPLFTIMDVGHDLEKMLQKVEGMFHLFTNNVQCKHLIFGCCHNSAYALTLEPYASNPISASSITLLMSYERNTYFESLPFSSVEFPRVFRSAPFKETDRSAEENDYLQRPESECDSIKQKGEELSARVTEKVELPIKSPAAVDVSVPISARPQAKTHPSWSTEMRILLNIDDERVDFDLGKVDYETSESMLDRMEVQRFCGYHHLTDRCAAIAVGGVCRYRHGPRLNDDELRFLRQELRRIRCGFGSTCRKPDCIYGHVCADEPGCPKGSACPLYQFHGVDKTAVKVWSAEKRSSPRKIGRRV